MGPRGGRLVVFSTSTMWGRGLAIISNTADNGNASPYHYLFVLLGCIFPAETPLISPFDSSPQLILGPCFFVSTLLYLLILFILTSPTSDPQYLSLSSASLCPSVTLHLLSSSITYITSPSLSPFFFLSFPHLFSLSVWASLAGYVRLHGPGAAEHG